MLELEQDSLMQHKRCQLSFAPAKHTGSERSRPNEAHVIQEKQATWGARDAIEAGHIKVVQLPAWASDIRQLRTYVEQPPTSDAISRQLVAASCSRLLSALSSWVVQHTLPPRRSSAMKFLDGLYAQ